MLPLKLFDLSISLKNHSVGNPGGVGVPSLHTSVLSPDTPDFFSENGISVIGTDGGFLFDKKTVREKNFANREFYLIEQTSDLREVPEEFLSVCFPIKTENCGAAGIVPVAYF